jgi:hypothetical protein
VNDKSKVRVAESAGLLLVLCSRGRKQRMKDSENKGKGLTAKGEARRC